MTKYERYIDVWRAMRWVKSGAFYYLAELYRWSPAEIAAMHNKWSHMPEYTDWRSDGRQITYTQHDVTTMTRKYAAAHNLAVPFGCERKRAYKPRRREHD